MQSPYWVATEWKRGVLEFFCGGFYLEIGDVERKSNFGNFMYIFKPFFLLFNFVAPLCCLEYMFFCYKKMVPENWQFLSRYIRDFSIYADNLATFW